MPDAPEALLEERLQAEFEAAGCHALFGKTQGYYGPYIWRDTVPTAYQVELPDGTAAYTVNILRGFIFRSWMDYLTFGRYGTGGWASPDGTINCIEQAYDFTSERFLVSLLKHEAQHTVDMKRFPGITPAELEYRAKLVELHYTGDPGLLQKFLSEADESKTAVMDLIAGYPGGSDLSLGFFMTHSAIQGAGTGSRIASEALAALQAQGFRRCILGMDKDNPQSTHFWRKNGFRVVRELPQDGGTIQVAERLLDGTVPPPPAGDGQ